MQLRQKKRMFFQALVAQLAERILGKDEVSSSILDQGTIEVNAVFERDI